MIVRVPYGLSPSFDLTIGGASVDYQALNQLVIEMETNKHDLLTLEMAGIPPRAVTEYRNKPVRLRYDTGAGYSDSFTGYIREVRPHDQVAAGMMNGSPFQNASILCIGVSYSMRGAKTRTWEYVSLADIATEFAQKYRMSLDVPSSTPTWVVMEQVAESDWQFLVRCAQQLGMSVSAHNTHLHVYDPFRSAQRGISFNRLETSGQSRGNVAPTPGKIASFRGLFSDRHANGVYKNTVVKVVQDNDVEYDVTSQEVFRTEGTPLVEDRLEGHVTTYTEAVAAVESASRGTYDFEAEVLVAGLAGCQPGGIVDLQKYNTEYDGLWYVESVEHTIGTGAFTSKLIVHRNAVSELNDDVSTARLRVPPEPVYDNGWRSSKRVYRVY